jgi:hypothetical protein
MEKSRPVDQKKSGRTSDSHKPRFLPEHTVQDVKLTEGEINPSSGSTVQDVDLTPEHSKGNSPRTSQSVPFEHHFLRTLEEQQGITFSPEALQKSGLTMNMEVSKGYKGEISGLEREIKDIPEIDYTNSESVFKRMQECRKKCYINHYNGKQDLVQKLTKMVEKYTNQYKDFESRSDVEQDRLSSIYKVITFLRRTKDNIQSIEDQKLENAYKNNCDLESKLKKILEKVRQLRQRIESDLIQHTQEREVGHDKLVRQAMELEESLLKEETKVREILVEQLGILGLVSGNSEELFAILNKKDGEKKQIDIKGMIKSGNDELENMKRYCDQKSREIDPIKKYISICLENLQSSISAAEEYRDCDLESLIRNRAFKDLDWDKLNSVLNITKYSEELENARQIIEFREKNPTAETLLQNYSPSADLVQRYNRRADEHWRDMVAKRGDRIVTDEEFKAKLQELNQQAQRIIEGQDGENIPCIRRKPENLEEIFLYGRIKTMFETATVGSESLGVENQAIIEMGHFGFPQDLPPAVRSPYAYLTPRRLNGEFNEKIDAYGSVVIYLNKVCIGQRAFVMLDDSSALCEVIRDSDSGDRMPWDLYGRPVPYNKPTRDCFPLRCVSRDPSNPYKITRKVNERDPLELKTVCDIDSWAEVITPGGITIDEIDKIVFTQPIEEHLKQNLVNLFKKRKFDNYQFIE